MRALQPPFWSAAGRFDLSRTGGGTNRFYPQPQQYRSIIPLEITGSRDAIDSTVLDQLLTALAAHGLIIDKTTP